MKIKKDYIMRIVQNNMIFQPDGSWRISGKGIAIMKDHNIWLSEVEDYYNKYKQRIHERNK